MRLRQISGAFTSHERIGKSTRNGVLAMIFRITKLCLKLSIMSGKSFHGCYDIADIVAIELSIYLDDIGLQKMTIGMD